MGEYYDLIQDGKILENDFCSWCGYRDHIINDDSEKYKVPVNSSYGLYYYIDVDHDHHDHYRFNFYHEKDRSPVFVTDIPIAKYKIDRPIDPIKQFDVDEWHMVDRIIGDYGISIDKLIKKTFETLKRKSIHENNLLKDLIKRTLKIVQNLALNRKINEEFNSVYLLLDKMTLTN